MTVKTTKQNLDDELEALSRLALRDAFYEDFSALVNGYLRVGAGLHYDTLEEDLNELTSVYGRDEHVPPKAPVVCSKSPGFPRKVHKTLVDALRAVEAVEVSINGKTVFVRRMEDWYFTDGKRGC
jgi:hypothetical protein